MSNRAPCLWFNLVTGSSLDMIQVTTLLQFSSPKTAVNLWSCLVFLIYNILYNLSNAVWYNCKHKVLNNICQKGTYIYLIFELYEIFVWFLQEVTKANKLRKVILQYQTFVLFKQKKTKVFWFILRKII